VAEIFFHLFLTAWALRHCSRDHFHLDHLLAR
jgi:hypothetical protein